MIQWLKGLFNTGDTIQKTLGSVGTLAKDIKTIATGKIDPETIIKLEQKFAELDNALAQHQSSVINTEAQGNFLQKSWRPITAFVFLFLIVCNQFGLLIIPLSDEIWNLFKVMLGGYLGSRGLEKIVTTLKK